MNDHRDPDRWREVEGLFESTATLSPAQRQEILNLACDNPFQRGLVERLLGACDRGRDRVEGDPEVDPDHAPFGEIEITRDERGKLARIGAYRLMEVLGEGGMGKVFLAEQTEPMRRQVALKLIRAAKLSSDTRHRFEVERQALARMNHPNIAQVHEAGDTVDGQPFVVM